MSELFVVTGGSGFVGKALARSLVTDGFRVRTISRSIPEDLRALGVDCRSVDLSQSSDLTEHLAGAAGVFHVAAKVDMWGKYSDFWNANVIGTDRIISACRSASVPRLVLTSSPSVVAGGGDLSGVDESVPYPAHHLAFYPSTKAEAERRVLQAHRDGLATLALRPHLIWGPGDQNLVPTVLARARAGRLVQVGDGRNRSDFTWIDDCVAAHRRAMDALVSNPRAGGRPYFISQGDPMPLWEWVNEILTIHGMSRISRRVPQWLAGGLATVCEAAMPLLPWAKEPLLSRFLVKEMATEHFFDISAARIELGFTPRFSIREALEQYRRAVAGGMS